MSYKNQLRGWALDRATTLKFVNKENSSIEELKIAADEIYEYAYERDMDEKDLIDQLEEIQHNKATEEAIKMQPASSAGAN